MRKLTLFISTLVVSTALLGVANAQEEARIYRFGVESALSRLTNRTTHFGGEFYLTDRLGISAAVGTNHGPYPSAYDFRAGYTEIGAAYYFGGFANSSGYIHGYVARWNAEVSNSFFVSQNFTGGVTNFTSGSTKITGEAAWQNFGVVFGQRWQGKRWYLRTGLGYALARDIEVVLESSNGLEEETIFLRAHDGAIRTSNKDANMGGFISSIVLGRAF